jgi:hypothetical protein
MPQVSGAHKKSFSERKAGEKLHISEKVGFFFPLLEEHLLGVPFLMQTRPRIQGQCARH